MQTNPLYEGKYFYEVVKEDGKITLLGPNYGIHFAVKSEAAQSQLKANAELSPEDLKKVYAYIEVINGEPTRAFTEEEILVTNRVL